MRNIICRFHKNQKKCLPKIRISLTIMSLLQCKQIVRKVVFNEKITIIELHKLYYVLVYDLVIGPRPGLFDLNHDSNHTNKKSLIYDFFLFPIF